MLYCYNNNLNADGIAPFQKLVTNLPQKPNILESVQRDKSLNPYEVRDQVYVKTATVICTSVWKFDVITSAVSNTTVKVNNITRHVGDIRLCWRSKKQVQFQSEVEIKFDIIGTLYGGEQNEHEHSVDSGNSRSQTVKLRETPVFYVGGAYN